MSARTVIFSVSLAAAAAGAGVWFFAGKSEPLQPNRQASSAAKPARRSTERPPSVPRAALPAPLAERSSPGPGSATLSVPRSLPAEEPSAQASKVEQEANHELRRLVNLLDLNEQQQDKVFRTLARHSSAWSKEMQFDGMNEAVALNAAKRSTAVAAPPGEPGVKSPAAGSELPAASSGNEVLTSTDPMDEIMALLSPDQQNTLLQEEMDRTAWWAEVLEQITPADTVPAIDGSAVPGAPQSYEGSTTLE